MTAKWYLTSDFVDKETRLAEIEPIGFPSVTEQSLSGISYMAVEGRSYTFLFDYAGRERFFDDLKSDDKLYYNAGFVIDIHKETHYVYIPVINGLQIDKKAKTVTITGTDSVGWTIKKAQDTEIDINRITKATYLALYEQNETVFPDPFEEVLSDRYIDRIPYSDRAALKYILAKTGISYNLDYVGIGLPAIEEGYSILKTRDDIDIINRYFLPYMPEDHINIRFPRLDTDIETGTSYPKYFTVPDYKNRIIYVAAEYCYTAFTKDPNAYDYRIIELIYRTQFIMYMDKPFFVDANIDGRYVYDGNGTLDWMQTNSDGLLILHSYGGFSYKHSGNIIGQTRNFEHRVRRITSQQVFSSAKAADSMFRNSWTTTNACRFYVKDFFKNSINLNGTNTAFTLLLNSPLLLDYLFAYITADGEFRYKLGARNDFYQTTQIEIDELIRKPVQLKASDMLKQLLYMNNLVIISEGSGINVIDKHIEVGRVTQEIEATREIPGDPTITLPLPIIQVWTEAEGGDMYGNTSQDGVTVDIPDITTGYLNIRSNILGTRFYYTTDGSVPTNTSDEFTETSDLVEIDDAVSQIRAFARKAGHLDSAIITVNLRWIVATMERPVITPTSGNYLQTALIEITAPDPEGVIRYTTNGSEPTGSSTIYSNPFSLASAVIKRFVIKAKTFGGVDPSETTTAAITIYPIIDISRQDIMEYTVRNQMFDFNKLAIFNKIGNGDQIESYLTQYYESKLGNFLKVHEITVDRVAKVGVRTFVKIDGIGDTYFVSSTRRDPATGLQHIKLWECEI